MTGYMTQYRKTKRKGESAYLIKFARTRARVRIKKKKFGEYPKERRKNNKNYCRTGEESRNIPSDKIRALRFLGKFSRFLSEILSPRGLRSQF